MASQDNKPKKVDPPYVTIVMPNGQPYTFGKKDGWDWHCDPDDMNWVRVEKENTTIVFNYPSIVESVDAD